MKSVAARRLLTLLLLPPVLALLPACDRPPAAVVAGLAPLRVATAPAELTTEPVPIEAAGVLGRRTEAVLSFKTGGVIEAVDVRAGDMVTAGQVLARLRLDEIEAQVAQARSAADKARRDFVRVRALQADRVATLENLQDATTAVELAEAALRAAEFNRGCSVLTAPAAGRILRRLAEPNELAAPGRPILVFAGDAEGWIVRVAVAETDVLRLHVGDTAQVRLGEAAALPATIAQIADGTDGATRTVEVELRLDTAPPAGWRSGFLVAATLLPQPVAPRTAVPLSSLIEGRGQQAAVFVLAPDGRTVQRRPVEIDALHADRAYLRTPLPAGTRVVTTGAEFLTDGRAVVDAGRQP